MAYCHGGVFSHGHHGDRLADNETSAHYRDLLRLKLIAVVIQNLHAGFCRTRRKAHVAVHEHTSHGAGRDAVDILGRSQRSAHGFFIYMTGERSQYQHTVNAVIFIQLRDF